MLTGNAGNNIITGNIGNDTLIGGAGADQLIGGAGTSDFASYVGSLAVTLNLKTGIHTADATGDTFVDIEGFIGSTSNDTFIDSDAFTGRFDGGVGTADTVDYSTSSAAIEVNLTSGIGIGGDAQGNTYINVERVIGSALADTLTSSTAGHILEGGAGNDVYIVGNQGVSIVEGAAGGDDEVKTALSTLSISGYANVERLTYTGTASATLTGNSGDNIITGNIGNDTLVGGAGADQLVGGAGTSDFASYAGSAAVTLNLKTGVHTADAAGDTFVDIEGFIGSTSNDTFIDSVAFNGRFDVGAGTADTMDYSTSSAAVTVNLTAGTGSGGDAQGNTYVNVERVIGTSFADTLASSTSGHTLEGGAGDDIYLADHQGVVISEAAGGGDDEIRTTANLYSILNNANIERLTFVGASNSLLAGNSGDNIITGGDLNDTIIGGAGADEIIGGAGTADVASYGGTGPVTVNLKTGIHTGDAAGDTFSGIEQFLGSSGNDTFIDSSTFTGRFDGGGGTVDTMDYSTSSAAVTINLTAGTGAGGDAQGDIYVNFERVVGSAFADSLTSTTSGHVLEGGAGDDVYIVGNQSVSVVEAGSGGDDEIRTSLNAFSMVAAANVERLTFTGTGNATMTGNTNNNIITGGIGNDTLLGGGGADHLVGGSGDDTASYTDSTVAVTFDLVAGTVSGFGIGDTFDSIEILAGSNLGDKFIANADANRLVGNGGNDVVSYEASTVGVSVNLSTGIHTGLAAGDTFNTIEVIQGSSFNDIFVGDATNNHFIGGAGADSFTGGSGIDLVWYVNNSSGVTVNMVTGIMTGGDADGDTFNSIEGFIGSNFVDELTGGTGSDRLEGAGGNDTIYGGDGSDTIFGDVSTDVTAAGGSTGDSQADTIYGGAGVDIITAAANDIGTVIEGGADGDTITVNQGTAFGGSEGDTISVRGSGVGWGGSGNDTLYGEIDVDYQLFGEDGNDTFNMGRTGFADGGAGSDIYNVASLFQVTISDTGISGTDRIVLKLVNGRDEFLAVREGNDLVVTSIFDLGDGTINSGARIENWYAGANTIEVFQLADGSIVDVL
ncbi:beta strand repeat-containing protein [Neorhizobium galegae]|uniref:beta strand repeat-containing protein n=1 Tax=Neorhizobium galegae TaxID=399 RepID=UPI000622A139|nr:calcium-binding protein [Neorhizobium galegae]CDZ51646.1 Putative calcium-binding protein [Neorhizobium galegae bv. orientalis]